MVEFPEYERMVARMLCRELRGDPDVVHEDGRMRWMSWLPAARAALEQLGKEA